MTHMTFTMIKSDFHVNRLIQIPRLAFTFSRREGLPILTKSISYAEYQGPDIRFPELHAARSSERLQTLLRSNGDVDTATAQRLDTENGWCTKGEHQGSASINTEESFIYRLPWDVA